MFSAAALCGGRRVVASSNPTSVPHPLRWAKYFSTPPSALLRIGHGYEDREDHRNDGNEDKSGKTVANGARDFLTVRRYERCGNETESDCD